MNNLHQSKGNLLVFPCFNQLLYFLQFPDRRNDNVGPGRRRLGPGVRRRVRASGGGRIHAVRRADQEGPAHRRRDRAQHVHGQGGRQDGALHRQLRLTEAEGRRLPLLRAQALRLGPAVVAGGLPAGRLVLCFAWSRKGGVWFRSF